MSHDDELPDPARIVLRRRIEWMDTDAAGIYHWTTVFRLAEAAEAALHTALGIADFTFGATPRVAVEASFARPLRFNDPVKVALAVTALGRTSVGEGLGLTGGGGLPRPDGPRADRGRVRARHPGRRRARRRGQRQDMPHRPRDGPRDPVARRHPRQAQRRRRAAGAWLRPARL